jgi:hypothetical protein
VAVVAIRQTLLIFLLETRTSSIGRALVCNRLTDGPELGARGPLRIGRACRSENPIAVVGGRAGAPGIHDTTRQMSGPALKLLELGPFLSVSHLIPAGEPAAGLCVQSKIIRFFERFFERSRAAEYETLEIDGPLARPLRRRRTYFWIKSIRIFTYFVDAFSICFKFTTIVQHLAVF